MVIRRMKRSMNQIAFAKATLELVYEDLVDTTKGLAGLNVRAYDQVMDMRVSLAIILKSFEDQGEDDAETETNELDGTE